MNKILLITTVGCEACKIQENIIKKAITAYSDKYSVTLETRDQNECKTTCEILKITDFPATIISNGFSNGFHDRVITGTCTKEHLMHLFDEHFIEK